MCSNSVQVCKVVEVVEVIERIRGVCLTIIIVICMTVTQKNGNAGGWSSPMSI